MKFRTFFVFAATVFCTIAFSLAALPPSSARADAPEPKGFKFKAIRGEDWPETSDAPDGGNRSSIDDDGEGDGRAPASTGMPDMKMNPDGTVDPESFKKFF